MSNILKFIWTTYFGCMLVFIFREMALHLNPLLWIAALGALISLISILLSAKMPSGFLILGWLLFNGGYVPHIIYAEKASFLQVLLLMTTSMTPVVMVIEHRRRLS